MQIRYIIAGVFVLLGASAAAPAYAQPEPIKTAREAVIESIGKLEDLKKNEAIEPVERLKQETELKREALGFIIDLSILETKNIEDKLSAIEVNLAFEDLRGEFIEATEGYAEYFGAMRSLLKRTDDLDGIQKIAGQLKDWRALTYDPGIAKAIDLILVFQNRDALGVADQRFEKLSAELKRRATKIRQSWQPLLLRASNDLEKAYELNDAAIELLNGYLPKEQPEEGLEAPTEAIGETISVPTTAVADDALPAATIRQLVEQSIGKIKEAYGKFISLNDFLKR